MVLFYIYFTQKKIRKSNCQSW